ncbi:hypothetical protein ACKWTF_015975 [Chironomus riparius]
MQLKFLNFILLCLILSFVEAVDRTARIINGTDATIEEFSFMVSLRTSIGHNCAATILNEWWVLTGAVCVEDEPISTISILHSSTNLRSTGPNIIQAEKYIIHEKFNASYSWIHDIAVVKLKSPIIIKLFDWKTKLAVKGAVYSTGTSSVTAGWGSASTTGPMMTTLQKVDLKIFSASDCNAFADRKVYPTQICSMIEGGYKGECYGDSGGPLLVNGVQVGIISWGHEPCASPNRPTVSTAIGHYVDWIQEKIGSDVKSNMFLIG